MKTVLQEIRNQKLLSGIALDVYTILAESDSFLTAGEVWRKYAAMNPKNRRNRNEIAKRLHDLVTWEAVASTAETVTCEVTNRTVKAFFVTNRLPNRKAATTPAYVKITKSERSQLDVLQSIFSNIDEEIKFLQERIAAADKKLASRLRPEFMKKKVRTERDQLTLLFHKLFRARNVVAAEVSE